MAEHTDCSRLAQLRTISEEQFSGMRTDPSPLKKFILDSGSNTVIPILQNIHLKYPEKITVDD